MIFWSEYRSISKMTDFWGEKLLNEIEKWCATHAGMGDMGSVILWVAWVTCLRGRYVSVVGVCCWGEVLAWVTC